MSPLTHGSQAVTMYFVWRDHVRGAGCPNWMYCRWQWQGRITCFQAMSCVLSGRHRADCLQALEGITTLDIARARARHAKWVGGVRPSFLPDSSGPDVDGEQGQPSLGCVHIQNAFHPLLLQPSLPPLPRCARAGVLCMTDLSTGIAI